MILVHADRAFEAFPSYPPSIIYIIFKMLLLLA
jgi:hypothetical protein